jgi:hypothetical protein
VLDRRPAVRTGRSAGWSHAAEFRHAAHR